MINDFAARKHEIYMDVFMPCLVSFPASSCQEQRKQFSSLFSTDADDVISPKLFIANLTRVIN